MVAVNPPGPSALGPIQANDGSVITSDEDGSPVLAPILTSTGSVIPNVTPGAPAQNLVGALIQNTILVELRVMNSLILYSLGATSLDLEQMRADEAYNISLTSGAQTL